MQKVSYSELVDLLTAIFERNGVPPAIARLIAHNCAGCERDGTLSHGIFRMPGYVASLRSGWLDGAAQPRTVSSDGAMLRVDAGNGFAQLALQHALPALLERVAELGVAVLATTNSHHFSALWPDVELFADRGLVALSVVNSFACVVPQGGKGPVFGTNPMAFATPVAGTHPYVFDQSSSAMSNGDVQIAAREGRLLPEGAGVDAQGQPTTDPRAVLDGGALLPFGGHKGASIALMVEVLSAALTGGLFSKDVDFSTHPSAQTPRTGQFLIVIDPERGGSGMFADRVASMIDFVRASGVSRLAGDQRFRKRVQSMAEGIALSQADLDRLNAL